MFLLGLGHDEDVIKIYCDRARHDEILEDVVHHPLEGSGRVGEPKEHDRWFE